MGWQCSTHVNGLKFITVSSAEFPAWITAEMTFEGENGRVKLREYLHESCKPFKRAVHVTAKNAVYYLVVSNGQQATQVRSYYTPVLLGTFDLRRSSSARCMHKGPSPQ